MERTFPRGAPKLLLSEDWTVDFGQVGVWKFSDKQEDYMDAKKHSELVHISGLIKKIPRALACIVGETKIMKNWDERKALLVHEENGVKSFEKPIVDILSKQDLAKWQAHSTATIMKMADMQTALQNATVAALKKDELQKTSLQTFLSSQVARDASGSASAAREEEPPRRKLRRTLSEVSVPAESKASEQQPDK